MNTNNKTFLGIATTVVIIVAVVSIFGIILYRDSPEILQGEIECTHVKISGKLLGRIEKLYVKEGDPVKAGDTLVLVNSPETSALMESASAMKNAAGFQSQKVDAGTREEIIASLKEAWDAAKSQADLANATYKRIERLYNDSVVTLQRRDEAYALAQSAQAIERGAKYQYEMALKGARIEDKESAKAMVAAAQGNVNEIGALLQDSKLTAPADGIISDIYPAEGELIMPGGTIMDLLIMESIYLTLNIREDMLNDFLPGKTFTGKIPALGNEQITFKVYYTSPLGSYATWQSSRQNSSYNLVTFKIKAVPESPEKLTTQLRPGMSVIIQCKK